MTDAHKQITDTELITELQRVANQHGPRVSQRDMQEHGKYSAAVYYDRFGSWVDAVEKAGVEAGVSGVKGYSDYELLKELRRVADQHGPRVSKHDMQEHGEYSFMTYVKRFESWNNAVEAAGLEPNTKPGNYIPDEELITELQRLADELDKRPSRKLMQEHGEYHPTTYKNRFGTWREALDAAGLSSDWKSQHQLYHTDEDLLRDLQRVAEKIDRDYVTIDTYSEHGQYSHSTCNDRFGGWREALDAAGLPSELKGEHRTAKIPTDELLEELRCVADELGHTPTIKDMESHGKYSPQTYIRRFGSWTGAAEAVGLEPNKRGAA